MKINKIALIIIGSLLLLSSGAFLLFGVKSNSDHVNNMLVLYQDDFIYKNAFREVNKNEEVHDVFGNLSPISLNFLEDNVVYSNAHTIVNITTKLKGDKQKGKLDIVAHKLNNKWYYTSIKVRLKKPKITIYVIQ